MRQSHLCYSLSWPHCMKEILLQEISIFYQYLRWTLQVEPILPQTPPQINMGNPFSTAHDGGQSSSNLHSQGQGHYDVEPTTSAKSEQKVEEPVRKRKQSQIAVVLEDYVDFRKKQTQQFVEEMKEPKQVEQFSIANCVAALEPMEDLTVAEKSKALRLFKCQLNREIFLNTKDPNLRMFWLKEEIAAMERT